VKSRASSGQQKRDALDLVGVEALGEGDGLVEGSLLDFRGRADRAEFRGVHVVAWGGCTKGSDIGWGRHGETGSPWGIRRPMAGLRPPIHRSHSFRQVHGGPVHDWPLPIHHGPPSKKPRHQRKS